MLGRFITTNGPPESLQQRAANDIFDALLERASSYYQYRP